MEFRILGSLEALAGGRPVPLGGAKQRAVLAILVLHRGEAVAVDRIVDELWGERPPETATKTVQVYVSRLRKQLGDAAIVTRGGGYALEVGGDDVDAARFERLAHEGQEALERGDPRAAAQTLRGALGLWRGPALADLAYESFAQNEIARLDELRLAVLENRIDADLALGRHVELVPELERLAAEHPTRERLRGQLMLALYRSGRQTDALESYRDLQRTLDAELGLAPGPELRRLERAILDQDPTLLAPARPPVGAALRRRRGGALLLAGGALLLAAAAAAVIAFDGAEADGELASANSLAVIDPGTNELISTVPTGVEPGDVSADEDHVWVANRGDDSATQVDPETLTVVSTTAPTPSVAGLAAGAGAVWITDVRGQRLIRLDPAFAAARAIRLARRPHEFTFAPDNPVAVGAGAVWVGVSSGGIARIDPDNDRLLTKVPAGNRPSSIATGLGAVWIADAVDNTLARLDPASPNAITATTPIGQAPAAVAVGDGAVWVANTQDNTVARVDPQTLAVTETISVGARPTGLAVGAGSVWVANSLGGTVSRIDPDTNSVEATIEIGEAPHAVTVAHDRVWVTVQAHAVPPDTSSATEDDVARVLAAEDPGSTDPALDPDPQRWSTTCALLYNYPDRPFPEGAQLQPEVAAGPPSVSSDGRTYTFEIRPGFRFSPPSNEPVTAAAFERALQRTLSPELGSYGAVTLADIVGADAYLAGRTNRLAGVHAGGEKLVIELTAPAPSLPARLANGYACAVPPETPISAEGVDAVPSAGPYYVAAHSFGQSLVLRRNPNYGGERPQGLEEIRFEYGVSPTRGVEEVEAGRADYVALDSPDGTGASPPVEPRLNELYGPGSEAAQAGAQQLFTQPLPNAFYFIFNPESGPFADQRLRQAVNYAVDRRALAANTGGGLGRPTDQFLPPGMPGFDDAAVYPLDGPDLVRARRLTGSAPRRAVLYTCDLPDCTRHAQILRSNLAAIGIELDVRQFGFEEMFTRLKKPGEPWDLGFWGWLIDYADPADFINTLVAGAPMAIPDELMRRMEAAARLNGEARLRAYAQLDRDLAEAAVAVPFATDTATYLLSARMGCQVLHPVWGLDLAALCRRDDAESE